MDSPIMLARDQGLDGTTWNSWEQHGGSHHHGNGYVSHESTHHHHPGPPATVDSSGHVQHYPYGQPMSSHAASSFESYGNHPAYPPHYVVSGPIITYPANFGPPAMPGSFYSWAPPVLPPKPVEYIRTIKSTDVLCGRGGATNSHSGNRTFRSLVKRHQDRYLKAKKRDKPSVAAFIVEVIRERGGRFLRRCEGSNMQGDVLWVDIGDDRAKEKTCQALREGAPEIRRGKGGRKHASSSSCDGDETEESPRKRLFLSPRDDEGSTSSRDEKPDSESLTAKPKTDSETRGDTESFVDDDSTQMNESEDPIVIRPCSRLMHRRRVRDIELPELTPHEQQLYLYNFLPPHPDIKKVARRKKHVIIAAQPRTLSISADVEAEDDASREAWEV